MKAAKSPPLTLGKGQCRGTKIGFVQFASSQKVVGEALQKAAKDCGGSGVVVGPAAPDPQNQVAAFQSLVASGAKGILVAPPVPALFQRPIKDAAGKGVAVEAVNFPTDGTGTHFVIGPSFPSSGNASAKMMASYLPRNAKGTFALALCASVASTKAFAGGFKSKMEKIHPGVKVTTPATSTDPAASFAAYQRIVAQTDDLVGVFAGCSVDSRQLIKVKEQNRSAKWVTGALVGPVDLPIAVSAILNGSLTAVASPRDFVTGYVGAEFLLRKLKLRKNPPSGFLNTGVDFVNKNNARQIRRVVASADAALSYYKGLINAMLRSPKPTTPQATAITTIYRNPTRTGK